MDTDKCQVLLQVIDHGSLTAAAQALGYTTSGVSRIVTSLEAELGLTLLLRSREGAEATPACRRLLPFLRQMCRQADCCRQEAAALRGLEQGEIAVGIAYGSYFRDLARLMAAFQAEHPGVTFRTLEGPSTRLLRAMEAGQADLCLMSERPGVHQWWPLHTDELLLVLPKTHPQAGKARLPLSILEQAPYVELYPGEETDNALCLRRNRVHPVRRYGCADYASAVALVEAGLGLMLINALLAPTLPGQACYVPVDPPQTVQIGLAALPSQQVSPAARQFLRFVLQDAAFRSAH